MRTRLGFVLSLVLLSSASAGAQSAPPTFTPTMARKIDAAARAEVLAGRTAGLAVAVVENGEVVYARGFGYASLAPRRTVGSNTQFYIAHVTEQFTAAAILLLVQDGKIKLGDKVTTFVPELTVAGNATVAQLLTQTSGLPLYSHLSQLGDPTRGVKFADIVAAANAAKPDSNPGTKIEYDSLNYIVAGVIVERVSGLPLSDFLQSRIFQPLYMNSTFYAGDTGISSDHAIGYTGTPRHLMPAKPWDYSRMLGASGLISTVSDLAKWDIAMPVLLRVDAVRDMFTPTTLSGAQAFGMGWVIDQRDGKRYIWKNGQVAGFHAMNALLPDDHIAVIVLANTDSAHSAAMISPEGLTARITDILLPPRGTEVDTTVVSRAKEWLGRLAARNIDRTQLTPAFSTYLTDQLVARSDVRALGKVTAVVPTASMSERSGNTLYEFLVRFSRGGEYRYRVGLTPQGKIYELSLAPQ